jgi:hypothetical protein
MTYAWSARDRLCPVRLVWHNGNCPKFEIARSRKRSLRAYIRAQRPQESRIEADRWSRQRFAGLLGHWPLFSPPHERRRKK